MKSPPLRCRRCVRARQPHTVTVERGVQRRKVRGHPTSVVNCYCSNGHEWWSMNKNAVRESRAKDREAKAP